MCTSANNVLKLPMQWYNDQNIQYFEFLTISVSFHTTITWKTWLEEHLTQMQAMSAHNIFNLIHNKEKSFRLSFWLTHYVKIQTHRPLTQYDVTFIGHTRPVTLCLAKMKVERVMHVCTAFYWTTWRPCSAAMVSLSTYYNSFRQGFFFPPSFFLHLRCLAMENITTRAMDNSKLSA